MPSLYHLAIRASLSRHPSLLSGCGMTKVIHLVAPGKRLKKLGPLQRTVRAKIKSLMKALGVTNWLYNARYASKAQKLHKRIRAWPSMKGALGCASILGANPSLLALHLGIDTLVAPVSSVPLNTIKQIYATLAGARATAPKALCNFPRACAPPR